VATVSDGAPGTINVLVPLPLSISSPCPADPGSVVVSICPTRPVVTTGPRGVITIRPGLRPEDIPDENPSAKDGSADSIKIAAAIGKYFFIVVLLCGLSLPAWAAPAARGETRVGLSRVAWAKLGGTRRTQTRVRHRSHSQMSIGV
jgi:hypothetical protein